MSFPIKKSNLYTRTGDQGSSSLFTGERRSKDDQIFEALGTIDELNSNIGLALQVCMLHQDLSEKLEFIQSRLFDVGSVIATPRKSDSEKVERIKFDVEVVLILEGWIDLLDSQLTPLTNFILPSGGEAASRLHVARSVCRRAERNLVGLVRQGDLDEDTFKFINRLSDFLFAAARTMASREGKEEKIWKKNLEELKNE